jgi:hypothetical protein
LIIQAVGHSVSGILGKPNIVMLKKVVDPIILEMFLAAEIKKLVDGINIDARLNIQAPQIPIIAAQLLDLFPAESLEDFVLCFKRGATGFYGSIFRLDAAVLIEWFRTYLVEKYSLIEAEASKAKKEEAENQIDYKAFIERKEREASEPKPSQNNAKENEYQRYKMERQNKRNEFQTKLTKTSSEFYEKEPSFSDLKMFEDERGFYVMARNESDAVQIYKIATEI